MPKLSKQLILALPKWGREHLLPLLLTIRAAGFFLAVLALWLFAILAYDILAQESFTFDKEILLSLRELRSPLLDLVMLGFTYIGEPMVLLVGCLVLSSWLLYREERSLFDSPGNCRSRSSCVKQFAQNSLWSGTP